MYNVGTFYNDAGKENSPISEPVGEDRGAALLIYCIPKVSGYVEFASSWKFILSYSGTKSRGHCPRLNDRLY